MATWCLLTGQSPATWRTLSRLERRTFVTVIKRSKK